MASLSYVEIPACATLLESAPETPSSSPGSPRKSGSKRKFSASDIRPASRIFTSLPEPTPAPSPAPGTTRQRGASIISSSSSSSPSTNAFSLLPQLLFSSTFGGVPGAGDGGAAAAGVGGDGGDAMSAGRKGAASGAASAGTAMQPVLLTTRDPLSLPTTSTNFKRFVERVGPIFWFQDRVEEVVMWRRGPAVTGVWIAAYGLLCYFPKLVFLLPHIVLIGVILGTYPYPLDYLSQHAPGSRSAPPPPPPSRPTEGSVNWQANLQAIQNIMGFVADAYDFVQPCMRHFQLSPAHFSASPSFFVPSPLPEAKHGPAEPQAPASAEAQPSHFSSPPSPRHSPVLSPRHARVASLSQAQTQSQSLPVTSAPSPVPTREAHHPQPHPHPSPPSPAPAPVTSQPHNYSPYPPYVLLLLVLTFPILLMMVSSPYFPTRLVAFGAGVLPLGVTHPWVRSFVWPMAPVIVPWVLESSVGIWLHLVHTWQAKVEIFRRWTRKFKKLPQETEEEAPQIDEPDLALYDQDVPFTTLIERVLDDDRLTDACWRAEMRIVELWENERFVGHTSSITASGPAGLATGAAGTGAQGATPAPASSTVTGTGGTRPLSPTSPPPPSPTLTSFGFGSSVMGSASVSSLASAAASIAASSGAGTLQRKSTLQGGSASAGVGVGVESGAGGWSKMNLKPSERAGWSRGRDGWGGIGSGSGGEVRSAPFCFTSFFFFFFFFFDSSSDVPPLVSSNLTFSLAPGWRFVETEGWRKDRTASWAFGPAALSSPHSPDYIREWTEMTDAGEESSEVTKSVDGWVYTNDMWADPRPEPYVYPTGAGSVTRRRRWIRRIWYDGGSGSVRVRDSET